MAVVGRVLWVPLFENLADHCLAPILGDFSTLQYRVVIGSAKGIKKTGPKENWSKVKNAL